MEKRINKCLAAAFALALLFGGIAFLLRSAPHSSGAGGAFTFPLLEYLNIELQRLDVRFIPYDKEEITVEYKNDRPLDFEVGDNKLTITENNNFVVSLFAGKRSEFGVKIYLPRTVYRDITIYTGTGNIDVDEIDCNKLSAVTESGDISVGNMGYLASLSTTSGNIRLDVGYIVHGTSILNREGNIELTVPSDSSVAVDFRTKDGECKTDLMSGQVYGDYLYSFNGGRKQIEVTAEHGTLTINERK